MLLGGERGKNRKAAEKIEMQRRMVFRSPVSFSKKRKESFLTAERVLVKKKQKVGNV